MDRWNVLEEDRNLSFNETNATGCVIYPPCMFNAYIWPTAIMFVVLAPVIFVSILLNTMAIVILIIFRALKNSVRLCLCLISFAFVVIEVKIFVTDGLIMQKVLAGPYSPMSRSECIMQNITLAVCYNLVFYIFIIMAIERHVDNYFQIMTDRIDYKLLVGIGGAQVLSLLTSSLYYMSSESTAEEFLCSCLCDAGEVSWSMVIGIMVMYSGVMQLIISGIFYRVSKTNKNLLAQFDLLSNTHSLNERHAQKKRVETDTVKNKSQISAQLLLKTVIFSAVGNLATVTVIIAAKFVVSVLKGYDHLALVNLIQFFFSHMVNAWYHWIHVICLYKYCPGFAVLLKRLFCIKKHVPNVTLTITPAVEDYHVNAAQSMQMIENMWKDRGLLNNKPGPSVYPRYNQVASSSNITSSV